VRDSIQVTLRSYTDLFSRTYTNNFKISSLKYEREGGGSIISSHRFIKCHVTTQKMEVDKGYSL
jgi:hypothetical protein